MKYLQRLMNSGWVRNWLLPELLPGRVIGRCTVKKLERSCCLSPGDFKRLPRERRRSCQLLSEMSFSRLGLVTGLDKDRIIHIFSGRLARSPKIVGAMSLPHLAQAGLAPLPAIRWLPVPWLRPNMRVSPEDMPCQL